MKRIPKSIIRFAIIGGITTLIDFIIYLILGRRMDISIAKICSMVCASIFSYCMNKCWTFDNHDTSHIKYLWRYYITFIINLSVNTLINRIIYILSGDKIIAFIIATSVAMIINYLLQNFWVFKKYE